MSDTREVTRPTWKTVDYVGGGYVLQVKMTAYIKKQYTRNYKKREDDFEKAEVVEARDCFETEVDVRQRSSGNTAHVEGVYQPHRIVHLTELEGVSMEEFLADAEERGDI